MLLLAVWLFAGSLTGTLRICGGVSLPQCRGPVRAIELREGVAGQTVTCDDTGQTGSILWSYTGLDGGFLSQCSENMSCGDDSPTFATGSRNATSSTVTFTGQATRTGHGAITVTCQGTTTDPASDTCPLDVGYPADIAGSSCSVDVVRNGNNWSLNGSCSVTKVFSSRDRYLCQWFHTPPGGGETRPLPSDQTSMTPRQATGSGDALYYSYDCSFQVSLPRSPGTHTFSLTAFPGEVTTTAGTYNIALPTTRHNCPTAVQREGSRVDCTCSIETAGSPPAQAVWNTSNSNQLSLTLGSQHNDRHYDCQARWGGDVVAHSLYSPQVAYGPSSVSVTGPRQPLDTNGQTPMTLTCDPSTSNPSPPSYQWRRLPDRADLGSQGRITVTATRDLDGKQFECTASNTRFTDISAAALFNVSLHYPPVAAPVIRGYNSDDVTYAGENLTMTCTVRGGKPVASTTVIFSCPSSKQDQSDVHSQDDVTSTVTFDPLGPDDHGLNCTCTARWKNYTDWYTHREQRTLKVYSSPTDPHINPPSTGYPFIAGVTGSARVTCVSDKPGVPPVRYTWIDTAGGQAGSDGTLTFDTVTPDLHNRTVSCRASNDFTEDKNRPLRDASRTLQVYYHPVISLTPEGSTVSCQSTSEGTRCDVTEGDDVSITCHSRSYPAPASTLWYKGDPGGSPVSQDTVLRVTSASHVTDNGAYSCQSKTGNLAYTHPPLTSSHRLHLLVMYSTVEVNMTLNAHPTNLTVSEGDHVTVTCSADGRPSPALLLYSSDNQNDQLLESHQGGNVTLDNLVTSLDHVISSAECRHTATYRCTAENNVMNTGSVSHNLPLYVLCRPRQYEQSPTAPTSVNYEGRPVQLSVNIVAYPLPRTSTFVFHGPGNNLSLPVTHGRLTSACWNTLTAYDVTCSVTVNGINAGDAGFYSLQVANGIGGIPFSFEVTYFATTTTATTGAPRAEHHDVLCGPTSISFKIPLPALVADNQTAPQTMTLSDPRCRVDVVNSRLTGSTSLNDCGTTLEVTNDSLVFSNAILLPAVNDTGVTGLIPIQCRYDRLANLTVSAYLPVVRQVLFTETGVGQLSFRINQYRDATFSSRVADSAYPLRLHSSDDVFVELALGGEQQLEGLGMDVVGCMALPSSSPAAADAGGVYENLIENNCPASSEVGLLNDHLPAASQNHSLFRFTFKALTFPDPADPQRSRTGVVYIHCRVKLCKSSECRSGGQCPASYAPSRSKRAVGGLAEGSAGHQLSTGPLLVDGDSSESNASSPLVIFLGVVAACATLVAMVATVAWRRSRRTGDLQRLDKVTADLQ